MRIYIHVDMEGTSGIWRREQVLSSEPQYAQGRDLLMGDVNAAIAGCFDGGAKIVIVCDTHGGGGNFLIEKLDPRAVYETPCESSPLPSVAGCNGLILLAHHAKAGTLNGFLDHTQNSGAWFDYRVNGQSVGEIGQETIYAGHFDVPLIMVSGDEAACAEAEEQCPGVVTVAVKKGLSRSRARCLHPTVAQDLIRKGAAEAVAKCDELKPWKPTLPITLELTYYRADYADSHAARFDVERVDARTVRRVVPTAEQVLRL